MAELVGKKPDADIDASASASASASPADTAATGSIEATAQSAGPAAPISALVGKDPKDDLHLGKTQYRAGNYGDAEKYFRRAVEAAPRDIEAWVGLAASYDRLRRFDLADRAYDQALRLAGPKPEILNNQGYSYILRGDFKHARERLLAAQAREPNNPYIQNNLALLEVTERTGKLPK